MLHSLHPQLTTRYMMPSTTSKSCMSVSSLTIPLPTPPPSTIGKPLIFISEHWTGKDSLIFSLIGDDLPPSPPLSHSWSTLYRDFNLILTPSLSTLHNSLHVTVVTETGETKRPFPFTHFYNGYMLGQPSLRNTSPLVAFQLVPAAFAILQKCI